MPGAVKRVHRLPVNGGDVVEVRINRQGFRGPELTPPGPAGRIVVYGDSFVTAEFSQADRTFAAQLAGLLLSPSGPPQVINAGVPAYGPDQISLRLAVELPQLEPDLAIVAVFAGNDFGDLLRNKIYKLGDEGELVRHPFEIHPGQRDRLAPSRLPLVMLTMVHRLLYRWAAHENLTGDVVEDARAAGRVIEGPRAAKFQRVESWLSHRRHEYERYVLQGEAEVTNLLGDTYDADVSTDPESDSARYKVELMDRVLARIAATCADHDVPLVLLFIPSPIDVAEGYEYAQVASELHPQYRRAANTDALERIAERHGIPYVNLFDGFFQREAHTLYFRGGDDHWNDAGQRLAAENVADYLHDRRLLD